MGKIVYAVFGVGAYYLIEHIFHMHWGMWLDGAALGASATPSRLLLC